MKNFSLSINLQDNLSLESKETKTINSRLLHVMRSYSAPENRKIKVLYTILTILNLIHSFIIRFQSVFFRCITRT